MVVPLLDEPSYGCLKRRIKDGGEKRSIPALLRMMDAPALDVRTIEFAASAIEKYALNIPFVEVDSTY